MAMSRGSRRLSRAGRKLERNTIDRELKLMIEAQIPADGQDPKPKLTVDCKNGYVVLRGFVRTYREKERLHRFVMGLRGVKALKDLLRVQPLETLADQEIALLVRQALDAHAELPPGTATVHSSNGTCTLRGHVTTAEERHIAHEVASHCRGVKQVVNELTVDTLDEISDAATARAVKCALAYCEDFDIASITVSCADGKIVLRGAVPTMMDRSLAEEIARIQPGVRGLENHIQVHTQFSLEPVVAVPARKSQRLSRKVPRKKAQRTKR